MMNTGYPTNTMDMPFRFIPAMIAGLAVQLAAKKKVKDYVLLQMLQADYDKLFLFACREDRSRTSFYFRPMVDF
jgi:hypothetical protein